MLLEIPEELKNIFVFCKTEEEFQKVFLTLVPYCKKHTAELYHFQLYNNLFTEFENDELYLHAALHFNFDIKEKFKIIESKDIIGKY